MPVEMRETERNEIKRGEWVDAERTRERKIVRKKPEELSGETDGSRGDAWLRYELAFSEDAELSGVWRRFGWGRGGYLPENGENK